MVVADRDVTRVCVILMTGFLMFSGLNSGDNRFSPLLNPSCGPLAGCASVEPATTSGADEHTEHPASPGWQRDRLDRHWLDGVIDGQGRAISDVTGFTAEDTPRGL